MKLNSRLLAGSAALALTAGLASGAAGAVTWTYSDWDEDGNLELTEREFTAGLQEAGAFETVDVDRDMQITEDEFAGWADDPGLFDEWDQDETGWLGEDEFYAGAYDLADVDQDAAVTEEEFTQFEQGWAGDEQLTTAETIQAGEIITMADWGYQDLYAEGWSAENFIDEMEVYDTTGEEIGDVEDLIASPDGKIVAVIAEVGGFWDIGDTHVSIPWDEVTINEAWDGVTVPVTEENVEQYETVGYPAVEGEQLGEQVAMGVDEAEFPRAFRLSELIGDYARIRTEGGDQATTAAEGQAVEGEQMVRPGMQGFANYGYVSDVLIRDGEIAATVVDATTMYGPGYYAYPYYGYGYGYGWTPGDEYYDMPYGERDIGELEQFEYGEMQTQIE